MVTTGVCWFRADTQWLRVPMSSMNVSASPWSLRILHTLWQSLSISHLLWLHRNNRHVFEVYLLFRHSNIFCPAALAYKNLDRMHAVFCIYNMSCFCTYSAKSHIHWNTLILLPHPKFEMHRLTLLHCALSLVVQCIFIGPVCNGWVGVVCGSVTMITRNCVHRSSPNWVCRWR